ncbi:hypothetical protein TNCV_3187831 [Trichonephila clavipes]|nr:hypothetical protein TNCV_3187831 [Trichonephila clavipes]
MITSIISDPVVLKPIISSTTAISETIRILIYSLASFAYIQSLHHASLHLFAYRAPSSRIASLSPDIIIRTEVSLAPVLSS